MDIIHIYIYIGNPWRSKVGVGAIIIQSFKMVGYQWQYVEHMVRGIG
jgi:hypothetical protein